jgi:hypothetical protein
MFAEQFSRRVSKWPPITRLLGLPLVAADHRGAGGIQQTADAGTPSGISVPRPARAAHVPPRRWALGPPLRRCTGPLRWCDPVPRRDALDPRPPSLAALPPRDRRIRARRPPRQRSARAVESSPWACGRQMPLTRSDTVGRSCPAPSGRRCPPDLGPRPRAKAARAAAPTAAPSTPPGPARSGRRPRPTRRREPPPPPAPGRSTPPATRRRPRLRKRPRSTPPPRKAFGALPTPDGPPWATWRPLPRALRTPQTRPTRS